MSSVGLASPPTRPGYEASVGRMILVNWLHYLSDVSCTCINKLLSPAIDPEYPSLERIVEGVDEVNQRLRGLHSWGAPQDL